MSAPFVLMPAGPDMDRIVVLDDSTLPVWPWPQREGVFLTAQGPQRVWPSLLTVMLGCRHPAGAVRAIDGACSACLSKPYGLVHFYEYAGQRS